MGTQVYVFTGQPAQPSMVSYSALSLTADMTLQWPWVSQDTPTPVPLWLDITPSGAYSLSMPDATGAANGQASIFSNNGPSTVTVLTSTGAALTTLASGVRKYILLKDNSTASGTWDTTTFGTGTSAADAATLAGLGLQASGVTLQASNNVVAVIANTNATTTSRAKIYQVAAATGAGTFTFDACSMLGDGWWTGFSNLGTGAWTLDPNGTDTIDGQPTISINPAESCLIYCTGLALITVGRGRSVDLVYTALNKDVHGNADVTLTATEASNLLIKFFGALTGDISVIVPSAVNEYMIRNATTGAYTITVKTAAGTGVTTPQGEQIILKCDGTDVFSAFTIVPAGSLTMSDGSESAPGLSFTLEQTTGFYRPSAGVLGFSVLATEIAQMSAAGLDLVGNPLIGLAAGSIVTSFIADANVTTAKIASGAVTTDLIADVNVTTGKIADSAVTTVKIADSNVTTAKILDANVTTGKIADNAVTFAKMQAITNGTLLGASAGTAVEDITIGTGLSLSGAVLSLSGTSPVYNYLGGCKLSNNSGTPNTKIDVAAGSAANSTNAVVIISSGYTIDFSTTGANALDTGSIASSTKYACYVISKLDGTAASLASTSFTSPSLPSGYTYFRRIGFVETDGSSHLLAFIQVGRRFRRKSISALDISTTSLPTTATNFTLSLPVGKKWPIVLRAVVTITGTTGNNFYAVIDDPDSTDIAPAVNAAPLADVGENVSVTLSATPTQVMVVTNTSAQIRARAGGDVLRFYAAVLYWEDDGLWG